MAIKKTYKKTAKKITKKKYSLNERLKYYSSKIKFTTDYTKPFTKKEEYASAYEQGATRGLPLNFDKKSKNYQNGALAGERAKKKAYSTKF